MYPFQSSSERTNECEKKKEQNYGSAIHIFVVSHLISVCGGLYKDESEGPPWRGLPPSKDGTVMKYF